jgi:MFS family permease
MPQFAAIVGEQSPTVIGITISSIMFGGAISSVFAGQLCDRFGHLLGIGSGACVFTIGSVLQASSLSLGQFVTGRVVAGIGEGIYLGLLNVYVLGAACATNLVPKTHDQADMSAK